MENQNANATNPQSGDLSGLKKMFSEYQKNEAQGGKKRRSREEILAKYFVPRKTKELFRILPPKPGRDYIEKAFFHVVPTLMAGGKKKYNTILYCPAHNDPKVKKLDTQGNPVKDKDGNFVFVPAPCPLCEKAKKILAKQNQSIRGKKRDELPESQKAIFDENKKIFMDASAWEAKKFYIVRGIDKGAEKDGIKFWRFKHNFKKQGTYDKLMPILNEYVDFNQADFTHPVHGTDLSITMADAEWNGRTYKQISAISTRGKSPLHTDPVVVRTWLDEDITWRDVFVPRKAPGLTAYQYLQMVSEGTNPYWDDTDQNNKHWVFPGRPDLETAANTRTRNLDADEDENFEQASDVDYEAEEYPRVTPSNITEDQVGTDNETAVDVGREIESQANESDSIPENEEYSDLPF